MYTENIFADILKLTEDCRRTLSRIVQCGTVTAVNEKKARVFFEDTGINSDWLPVLQREQTTLAIAPDGHHTHAHEGSYANGWAPKIGDAVLVIFLPVAHADGFIIGAIP